MADNVAITAGSGTSIATDDVSGAHYQKMKIYDGTADSTNAAIVDSSGNLQVEVTNSGITGTAGSPNSAVLSVQGIGSGTTLGVTEASGSAIKTAVELIDDAVYTDGSGTPSKGLLVMGTDATNPQAMAVDTTGAVKLAAGTNAIGKLAANDGVDIGNVDVASIATGTNTIGNVNDIFSVANCIQWSHYSNEFTTVQTSQDLVAASGSTKFYIGRLTIATGYVASATTCTVTIYFGTGAYSAGTSKTVFRGEFSTIPGTGLVSYPGVVIGTGLAPFCISAASDALKITTSASTYPKIYVQVDYIRV